MARHTVVTLELEHGALLPLKKSKGFRVVCLEGALWITEDDDRRDVILEPGRHYQLRGEGTLVLALHAARIRVEAPASPAAPDDAPLSLPGARAWQN